MDHSSLLPKSTALRRLWEIPRRSPSSPTAVVSGVMRKNTPHFCIPMTQLTSSTNCPVPDYQCNHPPRSHKTQVAGGRTADGWASSAEAAYPDTLCVRLAMAFTCARTGQVTPLLSKGWDKASPSKPLIIGPLIPKSTSTNQVVPNSTAQLRTRIEQSIREA